MAETELHTERLELRPLPPAAAGALPDDRETAARVLGVALPSAWPQTDLLDVLPSQAAAGPNEERFGVWVIIERETATVVGDIGFIGPPGTDGSVEVGYSVIPDRRRRGYATEAARAMVDWARRQPGVHTVVAGCDKDNVPSIRTLERLGFSRTGETNGRLRSLGRRSDSPTDRPLEPAWEQGRRGAGRPRAASAVLGRRLAAAAAALMAGEEER